MIFCWSPLTYTNAMKCLQTVRREVKLHLYIFLQPRIALGCLFEAKTKPLAERRALKWSALKTNLQRGRLLTVVVQRQRACEELALVASRHPKRGALVVCASNLTGPLSTFT